MKYVNRYISALVLSVSLVGCTYADNATKVLSSSGFTNIEITGYNWFGCSVNDFPILRIYNNGRFCTVAKSLRIYRKTNRYNKHKRQKNRYKLFQKKSPTY